MQETNQSIEEAKRVLKDIKEMITELEEHYNQTIKNVKYWGYKYFLFVYQDEFNNISSHYETVMASFEFYFDHYIENQEYSIFLYNKLKKLLTDYAYNSVHFHLVSNRDDVPSEHIDKLFQLSRQDIEKRDRLLDELGELLEVNVQQ